MKDERILALDPATKISLVLADCTTAAGALARGHLSGPTASHYLAQALAAAGPETAHGTPNAGNRPTVRNTLHKKTGEWQVNPPKML